MPNLYTVLKYWIHTSSTRFKQGTVSYFLEVYLNFVLSGRSHLIINYSTTPPAMPCHQLLSPWLCFILLIVLFNRKHVICLFIFCLQLESVIHQNKPWSDLFIALPQVLCTTSQGHGRHSKIFVKNIIKRPSVSIS